MISRVLGETGSDCTGVTRRTFLQAGVPAVDIIDLDYFAWHTAQDTIDNVSQRSLQIVGEVVVAALPDIEQRLLEQ